VWDTTRFSYRQSHHISTIPKIEQNEHGIEQNVYVSIAY